MGHIQKMTRDQRIHFLSVKYEAAKEARRGKGISYLNDEGLSDLVKKGYQLHVFTSGRTSTNFLLVAQESVADLRGRGNYARIVVNPCHNIKGAQTYSVYYRSKKQTK